MSNYNNQGQGQGQGDDQRDRGLFSGIYDKLTGTKTESTAFTGQYGNLNPNNNYNQGQGNYNQGQGGYNQGQGNYNQGQGNYNQGQGNYNQGQGGYNQGQGNYNQGQGNYNQGQGSHNQGNYNQGQSNYNPGTYNPSAGANPPQVAVCPPHPSYNSGSNSGSGITFYSTIAIKHNNTGRFLSSFAQNYQSGSGQQLITCNQWQVGQNERWQVLPPLNNQGLQGNVQFNQTIRLRHVATNRHLHSHSNINSPISQLQEVSGFGNQQQSDFNDDWIIEKFTYNSNKEGGNWNLNDAFALKHVATGLYLFSHDRTIMVNGQQNNEVVCYGNGSDENNKWRVQLV